MEEEQDAAARCLEIIAEGVCNFLIFLGDVFTVGALGGCEMDKAYTGPQLPCENGKFEITIEFIRNMIQWFKDGKTLPKRYVWEIALGAHSAFASEESLVELSISGDVTVDVIGDVHGMFFSCGAL
jgi:serine/threonine-protein phosphatase 5